LLAVAAAAATAALAIHHVAQARDGGVTDLELVAAGAFLWLVFTALGPYLHRDIASPEQGSADELYLAGLRVTVVVPAHNEDPAMFRAMLDSVAAQTRLPQRIHVVENGDPAAGYKPSLRPAFEAWATAAPAGLETRYTFHPVAGKREAQAVAIEADPQADIFHTVDSDVELDPEAVERGLAAFRRRRVMGVAGLLIGRNIRQPRRPGEPSAAHLGRRLLTRLVELSFVCSFLNGRASWSLLGSVGVNSGGHSMYRAWAVRKYLRHYLTHTVAGRRMSYGDDAMMTRYALLEGECVFQMGSWGYTLHPENLRHLRKQRTRWWRSFFWGNLWLLRVFPLTRAIWWLTAWKFVAFVWLTVAVPLVLVVGPVRSGMDGEIRIPWLFAAWLTGVAYLSMARYMAIRRPGESLRSHLLTWALAPLSAALNLYIGWALQYVGLFTCLRTDWSTRQAVEVGLDRGTPAAGVDEPTVQLPILREAVSRR
jgi:hyaluronan synthase